MLQASTCDFASAGGGGKCVYADAGDSCKDFNADRICDDNTHVRKTPSWPRSRANFSVIER